MDRVSGAPPKDTADVERRRADDLRDRRHGPRLFGPARQELPHALRETVVPVCRPSPSRLRGGREHAQDLVERLFDPELVRRRPLAHVPRNQAHQRRGTAIERNVRRGEGPARIAPQSGVQTQEQLRFHRHPLAVVAPPIHAKAPVRMAGVVQHRDRSVRNERLSLRLRDADRRPRERDRRTIADRAGRLEALVVRRRLEASQRYRRIAPQEPLVGADARSGRLRFHDSILSRNPARVAS